MNEREMLAKRDAAVQWCQHASDHAVSHGGKRWSYAMIPHDAVAGNMTLERLATQFACAPGSGVR
jgi:type III restriction enzyme